MIKQTQISDIHIVSENISSLEISHTRPRRLTISCEIIDTETSWFGFEEKIVHDYAFVDSILMSRLYFAILSVRESEPVLM